MVGTWTKQYLEIRSGRQWLTGFLSFFAKNKTNANKYPVKKTFFYSDRLRLIIYFFLNPKKDFNVVLNLASV